MLWKPNSRIEGIEYKINTIKNPSVHKEKNILLRYTKNILQHNKLYKKNSKLSRNKYIAIYSMEKILITGGAGVYRITRCSFVCQEISEQ